TGVAAGMAGIPDSTGQYIRILEPREWSGFASRGIEIPARRAVRVVGFASHPSGVTSVEIDGRLAALSREAGGSYRFTGFVPAADSGTREVVILVHPVNGLPIVGRYTLHGTPAQHTFGAREEAWSPESGYHGQRWALVVGIASYADSAITPLNFADDDAQAVYDFLRSPRAGLDGFQADHVKLLLNEQATYAGLRNALFSFLRRSSEDDEVVIYFAGHGAPDPLRPSDLYLLTYDSHPANLSATAFPMRDLNRAVEELYARHIVLITDACHSGGVTADLAARGGRNPIQNAFLEQMNASKAGLAVFTASQADQPSFEDARWGGGHGVFTYYLLAGLAGAADEDGDHIVSAVELMHWTTEQVRRETSNAQIPSIGDHTYDPFLPLSMVLTPDEERVSRAEAPPPAPAAPEVAHDPAARLLADSIARAQDAVRMFPNSAPYRLNLGRLLLRATRVDDALRELNAATHLNTSDPVYRYALGVGYRQAGRLPEAIGEFQAAVSGDRGSGTYQHALGLALLAAGRAEEASATLRRAVRIDPSSADYNAALGRALWKWGRLREAVQALQTAVQRDPASAPNHRDLSAVLAEYGQPDLALGEMREAARLAPDRADYAAELAALLQTAQLRGEALQAMQAAVHADSGNAQYRDGLGELYRAANQKYEALLEFRAAVRLLPGNPSYRLHLGELLGESDQVDSAIVQLREAVRLAPDSARFVHGLGTALHRALLPAEALEAFTHATRLDPANAAYAYDLGMMYLEAGRYGEATAALQRAVDLAPGNRDYVTQLRYAQRRARSG
ncbi:MAG TPA: tetratricopeptide repeat protein, partial [Longimicrobiaceae bacterium]|nr:tetratricopeptide repeat protein [Longimicrobiaceae bacterium]